MRKINTRDFSIATLTASHWEAGTTVSRYFGRDLSKLSPKHLRNSKEGPSRFSTDRAEALLEAPAFVSSRVA